MKKLALIAAVIVALPAMAQKVNGKIAFPKGQKLEVVTEMKKSTSLEVMGQSMETTVNSTMTESMDIENADANGATIEYKVKRLVMNMEGGMGGGPQSFDSEKEGDRNGQLGKLLEKSLKNKYTMMLDANGKVTGVKKDDDNPNGKESDEEQAMAQMMAQQLGVNFSIPKAGDKSIFSILPSREVAKGETWVDSSNAQGIRNITNYMVTGVTDTEITLDYVSNMDINTTQELMGQQATIVQTAKTTGKIILNRATGLLKQRTGTTDTKGTVEAQGMTIPTVDNTTIVQTVK